MTPSIYPTVAIVGSGPAGCFVAQFLLKKWRGAQITLFEALPAPYGLLRYGVAADHQGSKMVISQFDRMFENGNVEFLGNVVVGRDITFAELNESFDIVVLATGLNNDNKLEIPGGQSSKVIGAGHLLKSLNGHPHFSILYQGIKPVRKLGANIAVIGSGNVAIDVMRLVIKKGSEFEGSDIDDNVRQELETDQVTSVTMISRSGASEARCDLSMLTELIALKSCSLDVEGLQPDDEGPIVDALREAMRTCSEASASQRHLRFVFNARPESIVEEQEYALLTTYHKDLLASKVRKFDTIITAIGFGNNDTAEPPTPPASVNAEHVYTVGWYKRGPTGTVADNRKDAKGVADDIIEAFENGKHRHLRIGIGAIRDQIPSTAVRYRNWKLIDAQERKQAAPGRCRKKITAIRTMLRIAHGVEPRDLEPVFESEGSAA